jgi:DNA repair photolyase
VNDKILPVLRKGTVLTPSRFGCLSGIPTLNVTRGCLFQCAYCYARGYSQSPRQGEIHLYVNLLSLLKEEIPRKRKAPGWVILNTSSDCFQPHPDILALTYGVMETLLDRGIGISFLTKGTIPRRFVDLFRGFPGRVIAQVGIVSLSERYWRSYEPGTPPPSERLETIQALKEAGISPEIRIDPIIPFVTDTETEIHTLFERLKTFDVKRATLSYLHLRPAIHQQLMAELSPLHRHLIDACFRTQDWKEIGSSSQTKLLPKSVREKGYERIKEAAERFGIDAPVCQCKNPDLKGDLCSSGKARRAMGERASGQLPLFRC